MLPATYNDNDNVNDTVDVNDYDDPSVKVKSFIQPFIHSFVHSFIPFINTVSIGLGDNCSFLLVINRISHIHSHSSFSSLRYLLFSSFIVNTLINIFHTIVCIASQVHSFIHSFMHVWLAHLSLCLFTHVVSFCFFAWTCQNYCPL